jgi:hypothetical protein
LRNGAVTCYSKCYLRTTFSVVDRTRLRNRTTAQTQTLWAIQFWTNEVLYSNLRTVYFDKLHV